MATLRINNTPNTTASTQVMSTQLTLSASAKGGDNANHSGSSTTPHYASSNQIERVSLIKLTPLDQNTEGTTSTPLSPNTLTRLVAEQTKSHEALEALQKCIQADTSVSFTSDIRKELQESALKQRHFLNQVLSSPTTPPSCAIRPDDRPTMLQFSNDVIPHATPLTKKLFPDFHALDNDFKHNDVTHNDVTHNDVTHKNGVSRQLSESPESDSGKKQRKIKRSDTDNDTGVESDSGSDPGVETPGTRTRGFSTTGRDTRSERVFSPVGKSTPLWSMRAADSDDDELLVYLDAIQRRALEVESLIEKAKLDTVVNIRHQLEAEFKGVPLEEIPSKCHQRIDRAIQRYLQRELENIKAEYERKESGDRGERPLDTSSPERGEDLERENCSLKEKVESLETSVKRVDMLYLMQKKENECLTEKLSKLERQMANEKLMHESELDVVRNGLAEDMVVGDDFLMENAGHKTHRGVEDGVGNYEKMASLYQRLQQEEKQNTALKVAGQADQTTIRCLTEKTREVEEELTGSRNEVSELLSEIHELQEKDDVRERKLKQCEKQLKEVINEKRLLRETLIMSEHEISLLENKLGDENNSTWNESKHEILGELRKLEKHIKIIHKEKRKLENKYLAFKIENENLSESLISFGRTRDILTPLGSCEVSRRESNMSSHSSSMSSSLAGSDVEDEGTHHTHHGNRNKSLHSQCGRRRWRGQDHKDKQFAEAVAKKLLFTQKAMKDQNCNFSSFENSGQDLVNETDELVKRVDNLQAEKRAIKMELESIRSTQTENVKC